MNEIIKELAKEARGLTAPNTEPAEKKGLPDGSPFSLELASYPDIVIRKEGRRTVKTLAIMPSVGTIFIKTQAMSKGEPVGEPDSSVADENAYKNFTAGMPDVWLPDGFWTRKIMGGTGFFRALLSIFNDSTVSEMIRKKAFPAGTDVIDAYVADDNFERLVEVYSESPALYTEFVDKKKAFLLLAKEYLFCAELKECFGLDGIRFFLNEYEKSPVWLTWSNDQYNSSDLARWRCDHVIPRFPMKLRSFTNYVLYEMIRMGYASNPAVFFETWDDTLQMEMLVYGKVRDKYPKSLLTLHKQLSYKTAMMQEEIDEKKLSERLAETKKYEGVFNGLAFIAPTSRQDFYNEALAQANCLASYVDKVINGDCQIMFVRKKDDVETSYITLSVVSGRPVEAKYANNVEISVHDRVTINEWFDRVSSKKGA